jgi:organic hydroperoxide reductase OsmC/OhrA
MALSLILGEAKLVAERMETSAKVTLEQVDDGYAITAVHLTLTARVPNADLTGSIPLTLEEIRQCCRISRCTHTYR